MLNIQEILGVKPIQEVQSIMCIQPHPDDNEIGMGGVIKHLSELGSRVIFVTVTDGRHGTSNPNFSPDDMVKTRQAEKEEAGKLLGVHVQYDLGFEDGGDYTERAVMEALIPIIRKEKPEMVATVDPWMPYEAHPDHYKTGRAVAAAVLASHNIMFPEAGLPYAVSQMGFYNTSFPNAYVDITPYWDLKMEAILSHRSQFDNQEWPLLSQYFAYQSMQWYQEMRKKQSQGYQFPQEEGYAEAFKVLSTRQLHAFPDAIHS
ncbi:MAG: PIG-L deacetylase family protein [Tuberibacillus sp.]